MIDIMLNDRFYAAFRYKYCPAFKFDIEDMANKVYERYPIPNGILGSGRGKSGV